MQAFRQRCFQLCYWSPVETQAVDSNGFPLPVLSLWASKVMGVSVEAATAVMSSNGSFNSDGMRQQLGQIAFVHDLMGTPGR
jgi:hypothetical protein